jgi:metallophosphoesterase superfamily enzyme
MTTAHPAWMTIQESLNAPVAPQDELHSETADTTKKTYRTIWISDTHLGSKGCKADFLSDFLKQHDCEQLILVGDIIDGWRMRKKVFWPQSHTNAIRRLLTMAKRNTQVVYITGNHD